MKNEKAIYPIMYFAIWGLILFYVPLGVTHSGTGLLRWIIFITIFVALPYILYKAIWTIKLNETYKTIIILISPFLCIPYAIWLENKSEIELAKNGVKAIGIVDKAWMVKNLKRRDEWSITVRYVVDGKVYRTATTSDPDQTLFKGDTVTILYSQNDPQVNKIIELESRR